MSPQLRARGLNARIVRVPMRRPLGTAAATITHAVLLLIDLETHEGVTGRTYLFCYDAAAARALVLLINEAFAAIVDRPIVPIAIAAALAARFRLIGHDGLIAMATSGIDVACWDSLARAAEMPLARFLGADVRPIRAYNSTGLGPIGPEPVAAEAEAMLADGLPALKVRLGYADPQDDLRAVRAIRKRIGDAVPLMSDYNQTREPADAMLRGRLLDSEGLAWIEEPVAHDDYDTTAWMSRMLRTPIQLGENFRGTRGMAQAIAARACTRVMPDIERIGGVTGWMRAAAIASEAGLPMSSHLFPEVSAHLLAATPSVDWLEWVDWADPILSVRCTIASGAILPPHGPGIGLQWDEAAVDRYKLA